MKSNSTLFFGIAFFLAINFISASLDFRRTHRQEGKKVGPCFYKDYCLEHSNQMGVFLAKCSPTSSLFTEKSGTIMTSGNQCIYPAAPKPRQSTAPPLLSGLSPHCAKTIKFPRNANFYLNNQARGRLTAFIQYKDITLPEHGFSIVLAFSTNLTKDDLYMCWQFR
jgi:hypothetical protein